MRWEVRWTRRSLRDMDRLDRRMRERIFEAVERLAASAYGDVKELRELDSDYRLRVGDWRVLFNRDDTDSAIIIEHVLPRGSAYRS